MSVEFDDEINNGPAAPQPFRGQPFKSENPHPSFLIRMGIAKTQKGANLILLGMVIVFMGISAVLFFMYVRSDQPNPQEFMERYQNINQSELVSPQ
jgi:hypothetical protein